MKSLLLALTAMMGALGANVMATTEADTVIEETAAHKVIVGDLTEIELSGFGDFLMTFDESDDGNLFGLGQAEVDLAAQFSARLSAEAAIAYDAGSFGLGAFILEAVAWSGGERAGWLGVQQVVVGGGQYDIPFGIDWQVYPSVDRRLVTTPLVVELTHNAWNDYGAYMTIETSWGSATVYGSNGFCYEGEGPAEEEVCTENHVAGGGRLALTPFESLEVGGSYATVLGQDASYDMQLRGVDVSWSHGIFEVKSEYVRHLFSTDGKSQHINDGFYLQGGVNPGKWMLTGRLDNFSAEGHDHQTGLSLGASRNIDQRLRLGAEYRVGLQGLNGLFALQAAVTF